MRSPPSPSAHRESRGRTLVSGGRTAGRWDAEVRTVRRVRRDVIGHSGLVVALVVLALGAACSSGSDSGSPSSAPTATTAPPVTAPTAPPSTSSSTSTAATATATTVDPRTKAEADVRSAIALATQTYSAYLVAMPSCDPSTLAVARRDVCRPKTWPGSTRERGRLHGP